MLYDKAHGLSAADLASCASVLCMVLLHLISTGIVALQRCSLVGYKTVVLYIHDIYIYKILIEVIVAAAFLYEKNPSVFHCYWPVKYCSIQS